MSVLDLFDLHGKTALVTGASSGIGRKVAEAYLQAGAQVAIAARHAEALAAVAADLASAGSRVLPVRCDVTQPDQVSRMVDQVTAELGGVDVAVCENVSDAAIEAVRRVRAGDVVLVKGSRSVGAELVVAQLERAR